MSDLEKPRLYRSATDREIAGVCGGLAEYFGIDPNLVRIGAVVLLLSGGALGIGYLVAIWLLPVN